MGLLDTFRNRVLNWLMPEDMYSPVSRELLLRYDRLRNYVRGEHKRPIVVKPDQPDDNLAINFTGLVVDRSLSLLFGKEPTFDLPGDGESAEDVYLDQVWRANKKAILLHHLAYYGSTYGTCYVKLQPDGKGEGIPRLIALNPFFMVIKTSPEDKDQVLAYEMRYMTLDEKSREIAKKEVVQVAVGSLEEGQAPASWEVISFAATGGRWTETKRLEWDQPFPPIIHWQNLPDPESCYGKADIDGNVIALQDAVNFVASNINRILRYHAHPKTWGSGFTGQTDKLSWGADEMIKLPGEAGKIANLEMQSDLGSSTKFMELLRQSLFDISQTVDISSMADKLGALTNFGLRVLFFDAMNKLGTKRQLYGDGLTELNRRLLVLGGKKAEDPGRVVWQDVLPVNELDQAQTLTADLNSGVVSKETASTKRGYDWKTEEERINMARSSSDNVGAALLRAFDQGKGA